MDQKSSFQVKKKEALVPSVCSRLGLSRTQALQSLKEGRLFLNQTPVKWKDVILHPGDHILLQNPPEPLSEPSLLFEQEHYQILFKPAGWVCSAQNQPKHLGHWSQIIAKQGLVHRLDAQTSGLLISPKTPQGSREMTQLFQQGLIEKKYWAFVNGVWNHSGQLTLDRPIARHPKQPREMTLQTQFRAKKAITHFQCLERNENQSLSLIDCQPITGRTHQIRLHLCAAGFPLLGDRLYGTVFPHPYHQRLKRHALHAYHLSFLCPFEKKQKTFFHPFPPDLKDLFGSILKSPSFQKAQQNSTV